MHGLLSVLLGKGQGFGVVLRVKELDPALRQGVFKSHLLFDRLERFVIVASLVVFFFGDWFDVGVEAVVDLVLPRQGRVVERPDLRVVCISLFVGRELIIA